MCAKKKAGNALTRIDRERWASEHKMPVDRVLNCGFGGDALIVSMRGWYLITVGGPLLLRSKNDSMYRMDAGTTTEILEVNNRKT